MSICFSCVIVCNFSKLFEIAYLSFCAMCKFSSFINVIKDSCIKYLNTFSLLKVINSRITFSSAQIYVTGNSKSVGYFSISDWYILSFWLIESVSVSFLNINEFWTKSLSIRSSLSNLPNPNSVDRSSTNWVLNSLSPDSLIQIAQFKPDKTNY